jgi:sucrose-phosphate synthase
MSQDKPIYILMISLHGLIRAENLELGKDNDTGGQTKYVVELAKQLSQHQHIEKIDVITRLIEDDAVAPDYAQPVQNICAGCHIVRLPFGPRRYLRKESLWPHLDQAVDKCLNYLRLQAHLPDLIHTHYADAGYVGEQLSLLLGIPLVHTGHSLGRPKQARMLANGRKPSAIEKQFNFARRIATEESVMKHSSLIVTSTQQEIHEQYGMYQHVADARFKVIPPGIDTSQFSPPMRRQAISQLQIEVDAYFSDADKPLIIAISRPDSRKNIHGLMKAYGESPLLQAAANLLIVAGSRTHINQLDESQQQILTHLLVDVDHYNLWGKVAIPKHYSQTEIPELYKLAAKKKGVFVNPALTEPFGLTLIEAAASGLPIVAPDDGGPRDIISNCRNGVITNTLDSDAIAASLLHVLEDKKRWRQFANNGIVGVWRHYSWTAHVEQYMKEVRRLLRKDLKRLRRQQAIYSPPEKSYISSANVALISDIDNTLIGDKPALNTLCDWLMYQRGKLVFGVATGRPLESAVAILKRNQVHMPDVIISSVGTEIHYGKRLVPDLGWSAHIRYLWRRDAIAEALKVFPQLTLQQPENQREFKLSYLVSPDTMPPLEELKEYLHQHKLHAQLIYSHEEFLDILPIRASKGHAIRYFSYKWGLPVEHCLVAGDSGNDVEMLTGDTLAIVVGNHSQEIAHLRQGTQIYFAKQHYAAGILEGIKHYQPAIAQLLAEDKEVLAHV